MRRKLALIGSGRGGWVFTGDLKDLVLEFLGSGKITVERMVGSEVVTHNFASEGRHQLDEAHWCRVSTEGTVICHLMGS